MPVASYTVPARNTATTSENAIHHDDVARTYGFGGGLVPGVDVFAYLTHPVAEHWGLEWLRRGGIDVRLVHPVYDGDTVTVDAVETADDTLDVTLRDSRGEVCATATAQLRAETPQNSPVSGLSSAPRAPAADARPAASPESLAVGTVLGVVANRFHADRAAEYLADIGESLRLYEGEGVAHPGWLLRFANRVLAANVCLGPWIHVSSSIRSLDVVRDGDEVTAAAEVTNQFERKGHRFVELNVGLYAGDRLAQHILHTAIYEPRRVVSAGSS